MPEDDHDTLHNPESEPSRATEGRRLFLEVGRTSTLCAHSLSRALRFLITRGATYRGMACAAAAAAVGALRRTPQRHDELASVAQLLFGKASRNRSALSPHWAIAGRSPHWKRTISRFSS